MSQLSESGHFCTLHTLHPLMADILPLTAYDVQGEIHAYLPELFPSVACFETDHGAAKCRARAASHGFVHINGGQAISLPMMQHFKESE